MLDYNNAYILADQLEWLLVFDGRGEVSKGDVGLESSILEGLDAEDLDGDALDAVSGRDGTRRKRERQIDDCFDHLEYRERVFGKSALFTVRDDVLRLKGKVSSDSYLTYLFLLACTRSEYSKKLSAGFSALCKVALQRLLGPRAVVYNIDVGSEDRQLIGTDTREMARRLAKPLGALVSELMLADLQGTGDGGGDIVAAYDFSDGAPGHFTLLGQCAATASEVYWKDKLHQPRRLAKVFQWTVEPVLTGFIPVMYRTASGDWVSKVDVADSVMFDRLRIIQALDLGQHRLPKAVRERLTSDLEVVFKRRKEILTSRRSAKSRRRGKRR